MKTTVPWINRDFPSADMPRGNRSLTHFNMKTTVPWINHGTCFSPDMGVADGNSRIRRIHAISGDRSGDIGDNSGPEVDVGKARRATRMVGNPHLGGRGAVQDSARGECAAQGRSGRKRRGRVDD